MKIENMHVKTDNFIGDVDLDADGFGRIYYYILGDHADWTPQSEFLEINAQGARYAITHQNGTQAALVYKDSKAEVCDLKKDMPTAMAQGFVRENKTLLNRILSLEMDQNELAIDMFKTIIQKQKFVL